MDPVNPLTDSAAAVLGIAAFRSALKSEASVLQLFQAIKPIEPAQGGAPGQVTASLGNTVNTVA
jgi:hypothetical protein